MKMQIEITLFNFQTKTRKLKKKIVKIAQSRKQGKQRSALKSFEGIWSGSTVVQWLVFSEVQNPQ